MKVFFLARWFPLPEDPLWGLFVLNHARAVSRYADVFVIHVDKHPDRESCGKPVVANLQGIPVLYCRYHDCTIPFLGRWVTFFRMLISWHRSWRHATRNWGRPDINHVHILTRMGIYALIIKKLYKIPYVVTEHWSRYLPSNFCYKGCLRKWTTRIVVRRAGAIMPVTGQLADAMKGLGLHHKKYIAIPNTVDTEVFKPGQPDKQHDKVVFVHISTFDDRAKNIRGILRVMQRLHTEGVQFKLRMIGEGQDFRAMKQLAKDLGLPDDVVAFEGARAAQEVAAALVSSDFLLMFSHYENMPVVINESLACGIPVIATRVGGIAEVVDDSNGYLVEPGDEDALFDILKGISEGKVRSFNPSQISERALKQFGMQTVGKSISAVYSDVLRKQSYVQEHP